MRLSEHPIMKIGAKMMFNIVIFLLVAMLAALAAAFTSPAHAKDKKEIKRVAVPTSDPLPFDPERARMECVKKRDVKKCDMMMELRKNLEDIKRLKVAAPQQ